MFRSACAGARFWGVAGVEGNGQKEISEIITGLDRNFVGEAYVCHPPKNVRDCTVRELRESGVAHISEDRMTYGIVGDGSISDNIIADRYYKPEFQKHHCWTFRKSTRCRMN